MRTAADIIAAAGGTDWEFSQADTQYLTHNIHRYSGKFIPQIAAAAIEMLTDQGETVFDPYLGSGTTALEALLLDRRCVGVDLNPLAVLIAGVKTSIIDPETLREFQQAFLDSLSAVFDEQTSLIRPRYVGAFQDFRRDARYRDPWNRKWYQDHVLRQLIRIYDVIEAVDDPRLRRIAQVSFSDILRRSSNASSRYPNVMYDKNVRERPLPLRAFLEAFNANIARLLSLSGQFAGRTPAACRIILENNTALSLASRSADAIVTHPPYIGAIPYAEYGCLSLEWFGFSSKELDGELTGGRRQRKDVTDRFLEDYRRMFSESYRVLKPGGFAFYMVGNPTVNGETVDLRARTEECAAGQGFRHLHTAVRHGVNRRGNNMGEEYLLFFQKE